MRKLLIFIIATGAAFSCLPLVKAAKIKEPTSPPSALVTDLIACRAVNESAARLACFDSSSAKFAAAYQANDIYVVDKSQVRETRRKLFGLTIPNIDVFRSNESAATAEANETKEILSSVKSVGRTADGWRVTTGEDTVWQQVDQTELGITPKPGMVVVIRKGALGSYKMSIDKMPAIRVKRIL